MYRRKEDINKFKFKEIIENIKFLFSVKNALYWLGKQFYKENQIF